MNSVTVGQSVHGVESNVEASTAVVNSQDVDGLAAVCELPAGTAAGGVPASNSLDTTNVWEARDLALGLPVVSGDEAVGAIGARDGSQGARCVIVAGIVRDCVDESC